MPDDQLGPSSPVTAPTTTQGGFGNEMYQWSETVPESREHARHVNGNWEGDASTRTTAVLMFVSLQLESGVLLH
jgi:hypothetical protein